jgi:hypothetical protein
MRKRMGDLRPLRHWYTAPLVGMAAGCLVALLVTILGGTAVAQRPASGAQAIFEATHEPPLLTLPGERIRLEYDVHCAVDGEQDPERSCDVRGTVFLRQTGRDTFHQLALERSSADGLRRLAVDVPPDLTTRPDGFEYYAELETADGLERLLVPAGAGDAPDRSLPISDPTLVALGSHVFGATRRATRVVSARWGDGPTDVGLEAGRNLPPIGASGFDVGADGGVVLLDEAHRRALRWKPTSAAPTQVPLAIDGRVADIAVDDESLYVLESVAPLGETPLVRRFDRAGRALAIVETAERTPSQLRIGPDGPVVLQHPSHQWMPIASGASLRQPASQRRGGKVGRPLRAGGEVVVLRRANEILAALVSSGRVQRSWRITSGTPLGEVQLAEPVGRRLALVVRTYTDAADEFVVLLLDQHGLVQQFSTPTDEWAESAPLGRFRIVGDLLYRLGSTSSAAFVDRYDVQAR